MRAKKAVVAGHICLDITPVFPANAHTSDIGRLLRPGKLIHMDGVSVHTGGCVANTGLAMKILGAGVRLLAKVGDDAFGRMVRVLLDEYEAGGNLLEEKGGTTSYSVVLAPPGIDRVFLHCPGANDTFKAEDVLRLIPGEHVMSHNSAGSSDSDHFPAGRAAMAGAADEAANPLRGASLFHFGYPTLMKRMYADDGAELERLFQAVKRSEMATSLDLAAVDPDSEAGHADWAEILRRVLPYVDFFVPSFEELCFMLDRPHYDALQDAFGADDITKHLDLERDIRSLAEKCLALGANAVLIKCGAPGMYLLTSDHMEKVGAKLGLDANAWNSFSRFEKSFRIDHVVSGTGAGDTSIAAFLASLLKGVGPEEALENAAATGALCCTGIDALSGLEPLEAVRMMIDGGWEKYD
ncbi:MAG: carbohydrate kinase family protein [Chordicoccus sp.]